MKASLHNEDYGEKRAKILFHNFHSLLAMGKIATSTCVLTARILSVKACVVQAFWFFMLLWFHNGSPIWQSILASMPKKMSRAKRIKYLNYQSILIIKHLSRMLSTVLLHKDGSRQKCILPPKRNNTSLCSFTSKIKQLKEI